MRDQALPVMRMAQGDGQGVRGINLRLLQQLEQMHDHHLHLLLVRAASAGDGLLDLRGGVLGDLQSRLGPATMAAPRACPSLSAESALRAMNTCSIPMVTGP